MSTPPVAYTAGTDSRVATSFTAAGPTADRPRAERWVTGTAVIDAGSTALRVLHDLHAGTMLASVYRPLRDSANTQSRCIGDVVSPQ